MNEAHLSREEARTAGLPVYFTGPVCKRGHANGRRVSNGVCIECDRIDKQSARFRAAQKRYFQSVAGKKAMKRVRQSPAGLARQAKYREEGRDKEWQRRHYETGRKRETLNAWGKRNRAKTREYGARYDAAKIQATPPWLSEADRHQIAEVYARAVATGLTVDHIVPLRGRLVRGLHVPWNLQLLSQPENSSKNNRFLPDPDKPQSEALL